MQNALRNNSMFSLALPVVGLIAVVVAVVVVVVDHVERGAL